MREITTLCDVGGFTIVYDPATGEPSTWPEPPLLQQLIARYQSIPFPARLAKMTDQETYLKEKVTKLKDRINRIQRENFDVEVNDIMHQITQNGKPFHTFEDRELTNLLLFTEEKMKEIQKRIKTMEPEVNVPPSDGGGEFNMRVPEHGEDRREYLFKYLEWAKRKLAMEKAAGAVQSSFHNCSEVATVEMMLGFRNP
ncbi:MADS-box transcription factor PHERES 2-like [Malus sylvestris]|uniref:MADS-box transcription factor PHERES 2-like n=1 Tax=Malus domestica TaxID=3750 RepID=UPI0004990384|nr:MADS-box transcription factor PHERES 2-like [Malus domestica]XP_050113833.1 MADS-box transcription factor PHERES 2-like [Malus sylvestris]